MSFFPNIYFFCLILNFNVKLGKNEKKYIRKKSKTKKKIKSRERVRGLGKRNRNAERRTTASYAKQVEDTRQDMASPGFAYRPRLFGAG